MMGAVRALLLAVLVAALLAPAAGSATRRGHVRLVTFSPLAVRGTGFKAHEKVVVTATAGSESRVATVNASAAGAFTARFTRALPAVHCGVIAITAVGANGDEATWKTPQQVCGTQPGP